MRYICLFLVALVIGCAPSLETRKEYTRSHDRPAYIDSAIVKGQAAEGMAPADLSAALGKPDNINESYTEGSGYRTQWCYDRGSNMRCYYFENAYLTGWN